MRCDCQYGAPRPAPRLGGSTALRANSWAVRRATGTLASVAVLCALCALAGCGGSSSKAGSTNAATSAPASASHPTKAAYLASANTICRSARTKTSALIGQLEAATVGAVKAPTAATVKPLLALVAQLHQSASVTIAELQSLPRPEGSQAAVERFVAPLSQAVASLGQAGEALSGGRAQQALGKLLSLQSLTPKLASAAHAAGLTECAGVLSAGS